jgi:hypothetical protein
MSWPLLPALENYLTMTKRLRLSLGFGFGFLFSACVLEDVQVVESLPFDRDKRPDYPGGPFPRPNEHSWDGSWSPADSYFPINGLLDDIYFDGHLLGGVATPILPPGQWDWGTHSNLANWSNFMKNVGIFEMLEDVTGHHYGWRFSGVAVDAANYTGSAVYFEGSPGADILDLGSAGTIASFGSGNLRDGPDVLIADASYSLDFRMGSSLSGSAHDNDLAVLGCAAHSNGAFTITTSTFHTGPGADWVFVRDIDRAAIDLGNGEGGKTTVIDPRDGPDLAVLMGNTHDFRVFGGYGDDVFVWYVDDNVQTSAWLGPSFFGGGGDDAAVWSDPGVDRLILAIPTSTKMVTTTPTPAGGLLVMPASGRFVEDVPTVGDPYARYCIECGIGPNSQKTIIVEYNSADGRVTTGYFFVQAVEQLQVGLGTEARVYQLDSVKGTATLDTTLVPFIPPAAPSCSDVSSMIRP